MDKKNEKDTHSVSSIDLESTTPKSEVEFIKLNKGGEIDLSKYSKDELEKSKPIADKIDTKDVNSILNFGLDLQNNLSTYSSDILSNIRSYDAGEIGGIVNDLLTEINYIEVDPSQQTMLTKFVRSIPILNRFVKGAQKIISKYDKVEKNVDDIVLKLDKSRLALFKDNNVLDNMFKKNMLFIKDIHYHIIAAEMKASELSKELNTDKPEDEYDYQISDKKNFLNRLEKKIVDLKLTKTIATQTLPQIRIIQDNNSVIIEKIQSSITNTIPLWKNQIVIALSLDKQQKVLEVGKKLNETTNEILIKNSERLKQNSIETARQNEEAIVSAESIKKVNQDLINTLDEIIKIKEEGSRKRKEVIKEVEAAETELRDKILDAKYELSNKKELK